MFRKSCLLFLIKSRLRSPQLTSFCSSKVIFHCLIIWLLFITLRTQTYVSNRNEISCDNFHSIKYCIRIFYYYYTYHLLPGEGVCWGLPPDDLWPPVGIVRCGGAPLLPWSIEFIPCIPSGCCVDEGENEKGSQSGVSLIETKETLTSSNELWSITTWLII